MGHYWWLWLVWSAAAQTLDDTDALVAVRFLFDGEMVSLTVPRSGSEMSVREAVAQFVQRVGIREGMGCADATCVTATLERHAFSALADVELAPARCRNEPCGDVSEALDAHGSNKVLNGYGSLYDVLLGGAAERERATFVLEVGVGSVDPSVPSNMALEVSSGRLREGRDARGGSQPRPRPKGVDCVEHYCAGASLRAWAELFPKAWVVGLDPAQQLPRDDADHARVLALRCDSTDAASVSAALDTALVAELSARGAARADDAQPRFDLVVDDGLHSREAQLATLANLWPRVRPGGLYVVEDVGEDWYESLLDDRATLAALLGRDAPYFFARDFRQQSATGSVPYPTRLGLLVIRKPHTP